LQKVTLKDRQVLTVEPGLYYPGLGGTRQEDVVVVTKSGCRVLSRFPKRLEI
jgi:Xaa-Pro aminopeptidase